VRRFSTITLVALLAMMFVACGQQTPAVAPTAAVAEPTTAAAAPTTAAAAPTQAAATTGSNGLPAYTGGPAELRMGWWGNDDRAARTQNVIELFQKAYPAIKVSGKPNGGTADHFKIIDTQLAGNNAPT
jgi:multiple sugar transport system substrate-binding protein